MPANTTQYHIEPALPSAALEAQGGLSFPSNYAGNTILQTGIQLCLHITGWRLNS